MIRELREELEDLKGKAKAKECRSVGWPNPS